MKVVKCLVGVLEDYYVRHFVEDFVVIVDYLLDLFFQRLADLFFQCFVDYSVVFVETVDYLVDLFFRCLEDDYVVHFVEDSVLFVEHFVCLFFRCLEDVKQDCSVKKIDDLVD